MKPINKKSISSISYSNFVMNWLNYFNTDPHTDPLFSPLDVKVSNHVSTCCVVLLPFCCGDRGKKTGTSICLFMDLIFCYAECPIRWKTIGFFWDDCACGEYTVSVWNSNSATICIASNILKKRKMDEKHKGKVTIFKMVFDMVRYVWSLCS